MRERLARVDRRWAWILAWTAIGLAIRLVFITRSPLASEPGYLVNFDPIHYHRVAADVALTVLAAAGVARLLDLIGPEAPDLRPEEQGRGTFATVSPTRSSAEQP